MSANSLNRSSSITKVNTENFTYEWKIENFKDGYELFDNWQSPTFTTGKDNNMQWRVEMVKKRAPNAFGTETTYLSIFLGLVSCNSAKVPTKVKFSMYNGYDKIKEVSMMSHDFIKGQRYGCENFVSNHYSPCIDNFIVVVDITYSYAANTVTKSGPNQAVNFTVPKDGLSKDFGALLDNLDFSDVTFLIDGHEFLAHKTILAARSPVFATMFKQDMVESLNNRVEIEDMDEDVFRELLKYIYTDKTEHLETMAADLLGAGEKYGLDGLKLKCISALHKNISTENAAEVLALAELHSLTEIKAKAIKFINDYSADIADTIGFKNLAISSPHLMVDIFRARETENKVNNS